MFDYHIHPGYSIDAEPSSIAAYCRRAVNAGIKEICFTPHLEVDPARSHLDWFVRVNGRLHPMEDLSWLDFYFRDIEKARREWAGRLTVKAGLEAGYEPGMAKAIERAVLGHPFDFVLGSVHCLDHLAISSKKESRLYFPGKQLDRVVEEYYRILDEAVDTGLFDCVGHIDLYRRYGRLYFGDEILHAHEGFAVPLFEKMAAKGIGMEINTSSLRRGHNEFHPTGAMLREAVNRGIKIFTVGSDAHRLDDLGHGIDGAMALLDNLGIEPATFDLRCPVFRKRVDKPPTLP